MIKIMNIKINQSFQLIYFFIKFITYILILIFKIKRYIFFYISQNNNKTKINHLIIKFLKIKNLLIINFKRLINSKKKYKKMNNEPILGIDLGTTNSCIAIWKNNKGEVIPNSETGQRITPSIVSFSKKGKFIGEEAKNQLVKNYNNTIFNVKRLIGLNFNNEILQKEMSYLPYKIINSNNNKPKIEVEYKENKETFYPEEILGMILTNLKQNAEFYLGYKINKVIITCPAYFNDLQRKSTQIAGKIAGLNVVKIINEPTAAAIAYGFNKIELINNKNILVFDLGGGTLDVTILNINGNNFNVISTCGDTHLGGDDFDNILLEYCIKEFRNQYGIDISNNKKAKIRLKILCEKAKIYLSSKQETQIDIVDLAEGKDFNITIFRPEFEDLCKVYFNKIIPIIEKALNDGKLTKKQINEIILVGGSTRIPKITEIIKKYFNKEPLKTLHPDEAIAIGASILGGIINKNIEEGIQKFKLNDVIPLSLGLELSNGEMDIIIPRNTTIPCKKEAKYRTVKNKQLMIKLKVYQGERKLAKENKYLGECVISNIPPKPKGEVIVTVTFNIDENGSLIMTASEKSSGKINNLKITMENVMKLETINSLVEKAKKMEEEDINSIRYKTRKNIIPTAIEKINNNNNKFSTVQLSLGIELLNGEMVFIIKRDSNIPCKNTYSFNTGKNIQNEFLLKIYQGERILAKRNNCLKTIPIKISSNLKDGVRIEITFILNNINLLQVNVKVIESYSFQNVIKENIEITTLDEDQVEDIIDVAKEMKENDLYGIETLKSKNEFEDFVYKVKYKVDKMMEWVEEHPKEETQKYIDMLNKFKAEVLN